MPFSAAITVMQPADEGVPQSLERGGEIANMDGGAFEVAQGSRAQVVGSRVAKPICGVLRS